MIRPGWRSLWLTAAGLLLLGFLLPDPRDGGAIADWPRRPLAAPVPEQGHAFCARLPAGAPSDDTGAVRRVLLEDGAPIGVAADHAAIRELGRGRHSFWHGTLYFATSDNSDPRHNGRRYEVAWPGGFAATLQPIAVGGGWLLAVAGLFAWVRQCVHRRLPDARSRRRFWARLALVPTSLLAALAIGEATLRLRYPFVASTWPGTFDPAVGFRFATDAEVRRTNLFDYCVVQRSNSLGFLDREPRRGLAPGERRVLVLGDSFVEAVQVGMDAKFHVQLEGRLRERGLPVSTMALAMSGCGTSNQLAFYNALGRGHGPALVVVLLVFNDFANNSALLESVRNGWHPEHAPRPFFVEDAAGLRWQPIAADWEQHVLHRPLPAAPPDRDAWFGNSHLYCWTATTLRWIAGTDAARAAADQTARIALLRQRPEWAAALQGWQFPHDLDVDGMTVATDAPPAFRAATLATERSLQALRDAVAADGSRLLVVFADNLGLPPDHNPRGRPLHARYWLDLAEPICARLGLPFVDLHDAFARAGVQDRVTFARDRHWNALGHATAAAAVAQHLAAHPELLGR